MATLSTDGDGLVPTSQSVGITTKSHDISVGKLAYSNTESGYKKIGHTFSLSWWQLTWCSSAIKAQETSESRISLFENARMEVQNVSPVRGLLYFLNDDERHLKCSWPPHKHFSNKLPVIPFSNISCAVIMLLSHDD